MCNPNSKKKNICSCKKGGIVGQVSEFPSSKTGWYSGSMAACWFIVAYTPASVTVTDC